MARIVDDTGTGVVIEDRPVFLGAMMGVMILAGVFLLFEAFRETESFLGLCALFLLGCGALGFRKVVRWTRLTLLPDGSAQFWQRCTQRSVRRSFAPGTVRAGVESHRRDGAVTTRPVLLIDGSGGVERLPLSPGLSGSVDADTVVRRIMDWRAARGPDD